MIFVHEKNPLAHVSLAQRREVYARDGHLTTWGQLGRHTEVFRAADHPLNPVPCTLPVVADKTTCKEDRATK